MQYTRFGDTGFEVSTLGVGSIGVGESAEAQAEVVRLMNRLLDAGANLVDTAQVYPRSEQLIGRELAHRRGEFFLVTKCGHHDVLPDGTMRSRRISMADIDQALSRLRTDVIDAMLLHSYDLDALQAGEALEVLEKAKQAGKIRFAGYSGDGPRAMYAAHQPVIDILELSVSIADQQNITHVLPIAHERGLGVIAKKPIANAAWRFIGRAEQASVNVRPYVGRLEKMALDPADWGCTDMAELALRFALAVEQVHCVIASSGSDAHQDANIAAVDKGPLPREAVHAISLRFIDAQSRAGETWGPIN